MALVDTEGFGFSLNAADYLTYSVFKYTGGLTNPGTTIRTPGPLNDPYLSMSNGTKGWLCNLPSGASTFFAGCRVSLGGGGAGHGLLFNELTGNTNHIGVVFNTNGSISVVRAMGLSNSGYTGGTALGTSATGLVPQTAGVFTYIEVGVVLSTSATGSVEIRVNGATVLNLTGIITSAGGTSVCQSWGFRSTNGSGNAFSITHMYFCDNSGSTNNTFLGDVRVQALYPSADDAVQFLPSSGVATWLEGSNSSRSMGANNVFYEQFEMPASGSLTNLRMRFHSAVGGPSVMGLYSDSSNTPGTLLATSNVIASIGAGGTTDYSFASSPTVQAGQIYWIAYHSGTLTFGRSQSEGTRSGFQAQSYGSGLPTNASATLTTNNFSVGVNIATAANFEISSELIPSGATGINTSSTVGDQDTYDLSDPTSVSSVFGVNAKVLANLDLGSRTLAPVIKSGATTSVGTGVALTATLTQIKQVAEVDPDTGVAWTAAGVAAVKAGFKVTA